MTRARAHRVNKDYAVSFLLAGAIGSAGCGGEVQVDSRPRVCADLGACGVVALPLPAGSEAPIATDAELECQTGGNLTVNVTVEDPQGDADLRDPIQVVQVFKTTDCSGPVAELRDDLVGAGEEGFGTAVERAEEPSLYDQICGCSSWPVRIVLRDAGGHVTTGIVAARVTVP